MDDAPSKKPFIAAFVGNAIIAIAKFIAAMTTGSVAMIAEGIHSVVDALNNLLMLMGIRHSQRPPNPQHPFGHGKELYFWSLMVAVIIFVVGGAISILQGGKQLLHPHPLEQPHWNYIVLLISLTIDGWTLLIAYREFKPHRGRQGLWQSIRASKDPTKFTIVLEDGVGTLGSLLAMLGIWLTHQSGNARYDACASILIGLLLSMTAFVMAHESKDLLIGESAKMDTIKALYRTVEADEEVAAVRNLLTMHLGPDQLLLNLDVEFDEKLSYLQIAHAIERLEESIRHHHPEVSHIFIEARIFSDTRHRA